MRKGGGMEIVSLALARAPLILQISFLWGDQKKCLLAFSALSRLLRIEKVIDKVIGKMIDKVLS